MKLMKAMQVKTLKTMGRKTISKPDGGAKASGAATVPASRPSAPHQPSTLNPQPLLTRRGVAAILRVSTRTIDRMVAAGEVPVFRLGKAVRFHLSDVLAAMQH